MRSINNDTETNIFLLTDQVLVMAFIIFFTHDTLVG